MGPRALECRPALASGPRDALRPPDRRTHRGWPARGADAGQLRSSFAPGRRRDRGRGAVPRGARRDRRRSKRPSAGTLRGPARAPRVRRAARPARGLRSPARLAGRRDRVGQGYAAHRRRAASPAGGIRGVPHALPRAAARPARGHATVLLHVQTDPAVGAALREKRRTSMRRPSLVALFVIAAGSTAVAAESAWEIDPAHSSVQFSVRHMMVSNVRGEFRKVTGTVRGDEKDPTHAQIEATIDTTSIDTRNEKR